MKIKNISCTQFAGVRDRNVSFTDGINVIYGKNESVRLLICFPVLCFKMHVLTAAVTKSFLNCISPGQKKAAV